MRSGVGLNQKLFFLYFGVYGSQNLELNLLNGSSIIILPPSIIF